MPELPDLENFKENLKPLLLNRKIVQIEVIKNKPIRPLTSQQFIKRLVNRKIIDIQRPGKQLLFILDNKDSLYLHLMLHGEMYYQKQKEPLPKFTCLVFKLDNKQNWILADKTQWMRIGFSPFDKGGVNPIAREFTYKVFEELLSKKKAPIKNFLLDQSLIAGIGQAYADEILWEAKINPKKLTSKLSNIEKQSLFKSIPKVLRWAIREVKRGLKGAITGEYRDFVKVRKKEGQPCPRCNSPIRYSKISGQGTYYCPNCQK